MLKSGAPLSLAPWGGQRSIAVERYAKLNQHKERVMLKKQEEEQLELNSEPTELVPFKQPEACLRYQDVSELREEACLKNEVDEQESAVAVAKSLCRFKIPERQLLRRERFAKGLHRVRRNNGPITSTISASAGKNVPPHDAVDASHHITPSMYQNPSPQNKPEPVKRAEYDRAGKHQQPSCMPQNEAESVRRTETHQQTSLMPQKNKPGHTFHMPDRAEKHQEPSFMSMNKPGPVRSNRFSFYEPEIMRREEESATKNKVSATKQAFQLAMDARRFAKIAAPLEKADATTHPSSFSKRSAESSVELYAPKTRFGFYTAGSECLDLVFDATSSAHVSLQQQQQHHTCEPFSSRLRLYPAPSASFAVTDASSMATLSQGQQQGPRHLFRSVVPHRVFWDDDDKSSMISGGFDSFAVVNPTLVSKVFSHLK